MKYETAESVTLGHPDKLCDYIADRILDEALEQDPNAHVAIEVMLAHDSLFIGGELSADATINCTEIAHRAIEDAGYDHPPRYTHKDIDDQSEDIAQAVDRETGEQGAGDQGIVYGFSTTETLSKIPLAADLAHRLTDRIMHHCYSSQNTGIGPDGKAQVTVAYDDDGDLSHIASVLVSVQHIDGMNIDDLRTKVHNSIIKPVLSEFDCSKAEFIINPSGRFVKGGFEADTGLTGRKLMVDSYGGLARHGGGAFSGKDPSKVDRSGAYMARYIANVITAAGFAKKCEVSIAYAIGRAEPTAINVDTLDTWESAPDKYITEAVKKAFDLTPAGIIKKLDLKKPGYAKTAVHGHFGQDKTYTWEMTLPEDVKRLKDAIYEVLNDASSD